MFEFVYDALTCADAKALYWCGALKNITFDPLPREDDVYPRAKLLAHVFVANMRQ